MKKYVILCFMLVTFLCFANEKRNAILYEFGSSSCLPCKKMKPILEKISEERADSLVVEIVDLKKDFHKKSLISKYKIRIMPTQIFVNKEGKEIWRHQGYIPEKKLNKILDSLLRENQ